MQLKECLQEYDSENIPPVHTQAVYKSNKQNLRIINIKKKKLYSRKNSDNH